MVASEQTYHAHAALLLMHVHHQLAVQGMCIMHMHAVSAYNSMLPPCAVVQDLSAGVHV